MVLRIRDDKGDAATNNVTINAPAGETIDGAATATITVNYGCLILFKDGALTWTTVSRNFASAGAMGAHASSHQGGGADDLYTANTTYTKQTNHTISVAASTTAATAGGNLAFVSGAGSTSGAGGVASVTGGAGGATGAGGAASVIGGAGGSTSGTGGAVELSGGAGTAGNANGGAVVVRGGAKNGSGTDGAVSIGTTNTSSVTISAPGVSFSLGRATVSQATNVNTDVTCNGNSGVITTQSATTAAATIESGFVLNNSCITSASVVTFQIVGYSGTHITNGIPHLIIGAPGSGTISVKVGNIHAANALSGTLKIHFVVA
jgi:hypothetical protein